MADPWREEEWSGEAAEYVTAGRVIANGVDGDLLMLSVALTPADQAPWTERPPKTEKELNSKLTIRDWPRVVEWNLLAHTNGSAPGGLEVSFWSVDKDGWPAEFISRARALRRLKAPLYADWQLAEQDRGYVLDLWRKLMAPYAGLQYDWWRRLDDAILSKFSEVNRLKPGIKKAELKRHVLPTLRREAAFVAPLYRGREVMARCALLGPNDIPGESAYYRMPTDGIRRRWFLRRTNPNWRQMVDSSPVSLVDDLGAQKRDLFRYHIAQSMVALRGSSAMLTGGGSLSGKHAARMAHAAIVQKETDFARHARAIALDIGNDIAYQQDRIDSHHELIMVGYGMPPADKRDCGEEFGEAIHKRLFAVEAMPILGRLFNFTVDVSLQLSQSDIVKQDRQVIDLLRSAVTAEASSSIKGGTKKFFYLSAGLGNGLDACHEFVNPIDSSTKVLPLVTLACLETDANGVVYFRPCSRDEVKNTETAKSAFINGVVNLRAETDQGSFRYNISTVDHFQTTESGQNARLQLKDKCANPNSTPFIGTETPVNRTAGIVLTDGNLANQLAKDINQDCEPSVVDADTLTIGYRLDVGVQSRSNSGIEWRPLNERSVIYKDPTVPEDPKNPVLMNAIARLGLSLVDSVRLDGTNVRPSLAKDSKLPKDVEHVAEETLAVWHGELFGLQCHKSTQRVPAVLDFAVTQEITPVTDGMHLPQPPRLRFGQHYYLGMRPVYAGGETLPLSEAVKAYQETCLPHRLTSGRRFLRHERIDPPVLTIPYQIAKEIRANTPYDVDQAGVIVVRSTGRSGDNHDRRVGIHTSSQVLLPPRISLDFAGRHGVFKKGGAMANGSHLIRVPAVDVNGDPIKDTFTQLPVQVDAIPVDGLRGIRFESKPEGGFPKLLKDSAVIDPLLFSMAGEATCTEETEGDTRHEERITKQIRGDAILRSRNPDPDSAAKRIIPYYPDPAAWSLMLFARYRDGERGFLEGPPIEVEIYGSSNPYPDARPVEIKVIRRGPRSGERKLRQSDVIMEPKPDISLVEPGRPDIEVHCVEIMLAPGEDFDIVAWYAPRLGKTPQENALFNWFDVVESIAILARAGCAGLNDPKDPAGVSQEEIDEDCIDGIKTMMPTFAEPLKSWLRAYRDNFKSGPINIGDMGYYLPSDLVLASLAACISDLMRQRPCPEISSIRCLRVVHAVAKPQRSPFFSRPAQDTKPEVPAQLALVRRRFANESERTNFIINHPFDKWNQGSDQSVFDQEGSSDAMLGGILWADIDTTHDIVIQGATPSPNGVALDDTQRATPRSQYKSFRAALAENNQVKIDQFRPDPFTNYGFDVDPDGKVTFQSVYFTMMKFDVSRPKDKFDWSMPVDDVEPIDLLTERSVPDNDSKPGPTKARVLAERHTFPDGRARKISITAYAHGKFKEFFTARTGQTLDLEQQDYVAVMERAQTITLNATMRPARVDEKGLLPVFAWQWSEAVIPSSGKSTSRIRTRTMNIRLRLRRPWFSSGEDERLGIVLWPPKLFAMPDDVVTRSNPITLDGGEPGNTWPSPISAGYDSNNFTDDILGAGGQYITRWGADPIREGAGPDGWFMPPEAFPDFPGFRLLGGDSGQGDDVDCQYVESARMPLPKTGDEKDDSGKAQKFLSVALLTYAPRFDLVEENWYVDLSIDCLDIAYPFVRLGLVRYQENAAPELQVSEPVTEWIQLLPKRTLVTTVIAPASPAKDQRYKIEVVVSGVGSYRAFSGLQRQMEDNESLFTRHRPAMRMRLMRMATIELADGRSVKQGEEVVEKWESTKDQRQPRRSHEGIEWRHTFEIDQDPRKAGNDRFAVVVEEFDLFPPANYIKEGQMSDQEEVKVALAERGPSFIARIDLRD